MFQGRFKSIIVDEKRYIKELLRYIHLNPVRAGLVEHPEKYIWSSHRAYLLQDEYTWLSCEKGLRNFGRTLNEAMNNYKAFILQGIGTENTLDFKSGHSDGILGDEEFLDEFFDTIKGFQKREIKFQELVERICIRFDLSEAALRARGKHRLESKIRAILALFVRETENLSIEELAVFLGRDSSGLSKLANRLEKKCSQIPTLANEINELREWIYNHVFQMSECQGRGRNLSYPKPPAQIRTCGTTAYGSSLGSDTNQLISDKDDIFVDVVAMYPSIYPFLSTI